MKPFTAFVAALMIALPGGVVAQSNPVVVELYTSQGCSSCPPADALMRDLAERDDVIALSLHVDYWDYIGWKDEFGDPAYTKRQRAYARAGGRKMVYTPQMIVGGSDALVGARAMKLAELIAKQAARPARVEVTAERSQDDLRIRARVLDESGTATGIEDGPFVVQLVRFTPERTTKITRGENAGKTLIYANVVDGWDVIGEWDGRAPLDLTAPVPGRRPAVVLIQTRGPGTIVAAVQVD
jgi:hypothetical protein